MGSNYLISRKWALTSRFAITDETGIPQFEVHGRFAFSRKLSVCDIAGTELAVISRRGLAMRYQILTDGQETTVYPRGFFGKRFEIDSPGGILEARGNFSGRQYSITRGGMPAAGVTQLRTLREQFAGDRGGSSGTPQAQPARLISLTVPGSRKIARWLWTPRMLARAATTRVTVIRVIGTGTCDARAATRNAV